MALKGFNTGYFHGFDVPCPSASDSSDDQDSTDDCDFDTEIVAPRAYRKPPLHLNPRNSTPKKSKPQPESSGALRLIAEAYGDDNDEGDNSVAGCSPTTSPRPPSYGYTPATPERAAAGYIELADPLPTDTPPSVLIAREEAWRMKSPPPPQEPQDSTASDDDLDVASDESENMDSSAMSAWKIIVNAAPDIEPHPP